MTARRAVAAFALIVAVSLGVLAVAEQSRAQCSGTHCLPGPGYTFDKYWNCGGTYSGQSCFDAGNCLGFSCGTIRRIGWASADFDGSGQLPVRVIAMCYDCSTSGGDWGSAGIRLARACRYSDCRVNTNRAYFTAVGWDGGGTNRHTIYGHSKG